MKKLVITPRDDSSVLFLKRLFAELGNVHHVEEIESEEASHHKLLLEIRNHLKGGEITRKRVMEILDKMLADYSIPI